MVLGPSLEEGRYDYRGNDLVVALPHAGLVKKQLEAHAIAVPEPERSDLLGLALIRLGERPGVDALVEAAATMYDTALLVNGR